MKRYIAILFSIIAVAAHGQAIYRPSYTPLFTVASKPYAISQGAPVDGRSYKADSINFLWRPYNGTTEVLSYLPVSIPAYRTGQFPIEVNVGGTLNNNGTFTGGYIYEYWFRGGTADSNLVLKSYWPTNTSGLLQAANNLSDVDDTTTAQTNLGLGAMAKKTATAAGDLTGLWPNITVAKFNGELPSYYLNYDNLTNTPTIPAQLNPIQGANMSITGTYPNITFAAAGTGTTGRGLFSRNDTLYADSTVVTFIDNSSYSYDTIPIFNYTPLGSSLPAGFGGTATNYTISGGALNFTGNSHTDDLDGNYISYNTATLTESSIMTAAIVYVTKTMTDTGIAIGFKSINQEGYDESVMGQYAFNQGNTFGTALVPFGSAIVYGTDASSGVGVTSSPSQNVNINAGDTVYYTLIRTGINYTFYAFNHTQNWTIGYTAATRPAGIPFFANNTAYPALFHNSGAISVLNWTYSIIVPKHCDFVIAGNSITYGEDASDQNGAWANNVNIRKNNVIGGGGSDVTASVRARTAEMLKTGAKDAIIMIGGNDLVFGTTTAVWQQNLRDIRDTLTNNGIPVIWAYPTPRTSANMFPLVQFLDTCIDFTSDRKIEGTYYGLLGTGTNLNPYFNSGDGTHPNDAGHRLIAQIINDSLIKWAYINPVINEHDFDNYILANGRKTGQAIFGSTQAGGQLNLFSTTSPYKGSVNVANQMYVNENLGGIGVGMVNPLYDFDVYGPVAATWTGFDGVMTSARMNAFSYGASNPRMILTSTLTGDAASGVVITNNNHTEQEQISLALSTECDSSAGQTSGSYNYTATIFPQTSGAVLVSSTLGTGTTPGGYVLYSANIAGPYVSIMDYSNNYLGVHTTRFPLYPLDVLGLSSTDSLRISTDSYPAGTDSTLVWDPATLRVHMKSPQTPYTIFTPTTGNTITLTNNAYNIVNPSGALVALTVTLPSSPNDGDFVKIKYTQSITTVTYAGGTVVDGITSPVAGGLVELHYASGTTSWY